MDLALVVSSKVSAFGLIQRENFAQNCIKVKVNKNIQGKGKFFNHPSILCC